MFLGSYKKLSEVEEIVGRILYEATELYLIEGYDKCPGVPTFDVKASDDKWFQITYSGMDDNAAH